MSYRRLAPLAVAGLFGFGVAAPAAVAEGTSPPPTVTQTANDVTVSLPGIGSLTFTFDPTTGAVSNLLATADPSGGFTAGTPTVTDEGVQVAFTATNVPAQVLQVEVERDDGAITVKAESEADQPEQTSSDGKDQGDDHEQQASPTGSTTTTEVDREDQQSATTPTTEVEHEDTSTTQMSGTTPTGEDHTGPSGSDGGSQSSGSSSEGGPSGSAGGGQD